MDVAQQPDKNQLVPPPVGTVPVVPTVGSKEAPVTAPITIDTSRPTEMPAGVEPSYPEVHETADGSITPTLSAQAPVAEIKRSLGELGVPPVEITGHLNITPARARELQRGSIKSGGTWLGFLVDKLNKVASIFRPKQPINQSI